MRASPFGDFAARSASRGTKVPTTNRIRDLLSLYQPETGLLLLARILANFQLVYPHSKRGSKYLLVRVTGYNAYFVMLGKEIQDEIIARESHAL